ncbi:MAG: hypothetical protein M3540_09230 [Actinomycetota bacterium]|nr:hypothetical protein [Actinomycetota bacterium]
MGGTSSLLGGLLDGRRRWAAFVALLAGLAVYGAVHESLPDVGLWWDVAMVAVVLMSATFALVYLALPFRQARGVPLLAAALAVLAVALQLGGLGTAADFAKLFAVTFLAWWFLIVFEEVSWVVIVACVIPWVDAYSVWRGPTKHIVENRRSLFDNLSIAFPTLGQETASHLGLPDVLFFALFLAASARFGLRLGWTWLGMTLSFGVTIACAVWWDLDGLPALPALSLGFLVPNADLLWHALRSGSKRDAASIPRAP